MKSITRLMMKGAVIGAAVAFGIVFVGVMIEAMNAGCAILSCNMDAKMVFPWSGGGIVGIFVLCIIGGTVIAWFYANAKNREIKDANALKEKMRNDEQYLKQQMSWNNAVIKKTREAENMCKRNMDTDTNMLTVSYQASEQLGEIASEFAEAYVIQGKIKYWEEYLAEKGDR